MRGQIWTDQRSSRPGHIDFDAQIEFNYNIQVIANVYKNLTIKCNLFRIYGAVLFENRNRPIGSQQLKKANSSN